MVMMSMNWAQADDISMDNPLGGIKRGWSEIKAVYHRIFSSPTQVYVEFYDYTIHQTADEMIYAVGRERGYISARLRAKFPLPSAPAGFSEKSVLAGSRFNIMVQSIIRSCWLLIRRLCSATGHRQVPPRLLPGPAAGLFTARMICRHTFRAGPLNIINI